MQKYWHQGYVHEDYDAGEVETEVEDCLWAVLAHPDEEVAYYEAKEGVQARFEEQVALEDNEKILIIWSSSKKLVVCSQDSSIILYYKTNVSQENNSYSVEPFFARELEAHCKLVFL